MIKCHEIEESDVPVSLSIQCGHILCQFYIVKYKKYSYSLTLCKKNLKQHKSQKLKENCPNSLQHQMGRLKEGKVFPLQARLWPRGWVEV